MPASPTRRDELRNRLKQTRDDGRQRCWVLDCREPPGNTSGKGLGRFCRKHLEHYRRHGDPLKSSYPANRLAPYRKTAAKWIAKNDGDPFVAATLRGIEAKVMRAGHPIPPRNLRGVSATDRAKSVWARVRNKGFSPSDLLASILAVAMCYADDPQKGKTEYGRVQIAKTLSRMGGGEVKRWPTYTTDDRLPKERVLRSFPSSEGLVLRVLGKEAEETAEFLIHDYIETLLIEHKGE